MLSVKTKISFLALCMSNCPSQIQKGIPSRLPAMLSDCLNPQSQGSSSQRDSFPVLPGQPMPPLVPGLVLPSGVQRNVQVCFNVTGQDSEKINELLANAKEEVQEINDKAKVLEIKINMKACLDNIKNVQDPKEKIVLIEKATVNFSNEVKSLPENLRFNLKNWFGHRMSKNYMLI